MKAEENKEEFEGKSTKNLRKKYRELFTFLYIKITWCAIVTRVHYALIYGEIF
jgi:Mor family transcriptional regulator